MVELGSEFRRLPLVVWFLSLVVHETHPDSNPGEILPITRFFPENLINLGRAKGSVLCKIYSEILSHGQDWELRLQKLQS